MVVAKCPSTPLATRFDVVVTLATVTSCIALDLVTSSEVVDQRNDCSLDYGVVYYETIFLMTRPAEVLVPTM